MKIRKISFLVVLLLTISSTVLFAQKKTKTKNGITTTPCMNVLHRFTAAAVPALAPEEEAVSRGNPDAIVPANFSGNGLAQHPMLYVGENCNKMYLVKDGKTIWTYSTGKGPEYDDVWMLSNGNILFTRMQYVALITPDKKCFGATNAATPNAPNIPKCIPASPLAWTK